MNKISLLLIFVFFQVTNMFSQEVSDTTSQKNLIIHMKDGTKMRAKLIEKREDILVLSTESANVVLIPTDQIKHIETLKPVSEKFPFFIEAHAGLLVGYAYKYLTNVALGVRIHFKHNIAVTRTRLGTDLGMSFRGFGLQYGYDASRIFFKIEAGYITRLKFIDDGPFSNTHDKKQSVPLYLINTIGYRFAKDLSICLKVGTTGNQVFHRADKGIIQDDANVKFMIIMPTISITLPSFAIKNE